jgi:hypothetical protein
MNFFPLPTFANDPQAREIIDDIDRYYPRVIRYTLVMSLTTLSKTDDLTDTSSAAPPGAANRLHTNASLLMESQDTTGNSTLPWMAPCTLGMIKCAKRISYIDALVQTTVYKHMALLRVLLAVDHINSLTSSEYLQQPLENIMTCETIISAALVTLTNIVVSPSSCCVGLFNAELLVG